jgi:hypothetical protein
MACLWAALAIAALTACAYRVFRLTPCAKSLVEQRARAAFFAVSLTMTVAGYAVFLIAVGYPTQVWYYIPLLGVAGILVETSLVLQVHPWLGWRVVRLGLVVASLALVVPGVSKRFPLRLTNMDLVATILEERALPNDLILVSPWYLAISFDHYYHGQTPWLSIPDLSDRKLTRYDLVKEMMTRPEGVEPIANRVQETLMDHGRVWLVGDLPLVPGNPTPATTPMAPASELGWSENAYQRRWSRTVAHRIQQYANRYLRIPIDEALAVSSFENPSLSLFEISERAPGRMR